MMLSPRKTKVEKGVSTRARLVESAGLEFNERGFHGTDSNRIARRAGFAPQTFYRHFADKTDLFIAVYDQWQSDERDAILAALRGPVGSAGVGRAVAEALVASHTAWRGFRRSLRWLAVEDERVRAARALSRTRQLHALGHMQDPASISPDRVRDLLVVERLCDAAAEEEARDLGIDAAAWLDLIAEAVSKLQDDFKHST